MKIVYTAKKEPDTSVRLPLLFFYSLFFHSSVRMPEVRVNNTLILCHLNPVIGNVFVKTVSLSGA